MPCFLGESSLTALHTACSSVLITMCSCSRSWLVKQINVLVTLMVLFIAGIGLTYCNRFLLILLLLSCPPCDIISAQNQKHSFKKCKPDHITLLLKIPQWFLITSSQAYYCWSWLSCKSLCYFFDFLLIFPLFLVTSVVLSKHSRHVFFATYALHIIASRKECSSQVCTWLLILIASNSLLNSPFSIVFCN